MHLLEFLGISFHKTELAHNEIIHYNMFSIFVKPKPEKVLKFSFSRIVYRTSFQNRSDHNSLKFQVMLKPQKGESWIDDGDLRITIKTVTALVGSSYPGIITQDSGKSSNQSKLWARPIAPLRKQVPSIVTQDSGKSSNQSKLRTYPISYNSRHHLKKFLAIIPWTARISIKSRHMGLSRTKNN